MLRKLSAVIVAVVAVATFGCGGGTTSPDSKSSTGKGTSELKKSPPVEAPPD
jgi:hypothetical protein